MKALAIAATEGVVFPREIQIASGVYQDPRTEKDSLTCGIVNTLRRSVVSQLFWYHNPRMNISQICREISRVRDAAPPELKNYLSFLNDSKMRSRVDVKKTTPVSDSSLPVIPGVMREEKGAVLLNFPQLKVVLSTLAYLLSIRKVKTSLELIHHPLVAMYNRNNSRTIDYIIKFCLQNYIHYFDEIDFLEKQKKD